MFLCIAKRKYDKMAYAESHLILIYVLERNKYHHENNSLLIVFIKSASDLKQ